MELEPCPFCGSEPTVDNKSAVEGGPVLIFCQPCYEDTGRTVDAVADTLSDSAKEWNTRYSKAKQTGKKAKR